MISYNKTNTKKESLKTLLYYLDVLRRLKFPKIKILGFYLTKIKILDLLVLQGSEECT